MALRRDRGGGRPRFLLTYHSSCRKSSESQVKKEQAERRGSRHARRLRTLQVDQQATGSSGWDALSESLGLWITVHGVLIFLSGVTFGAGVIRAGGLSRT
jgi:hypothetical protein